MASDPSLIEISGEDDSLLQQIPTDDVSRNFFSCSPLQIHGSKPPLPPVDSVNKENVNLNKHELLKLSLEPQQMKRKKKGGGYNLRKSLAWDRAFSTEEGFLDPVELSMISGSIGSCTEDKLPVINEEGGESLSEFPNSQSDSGDLALEEKLCKELPVNTTKESRTKHSSSPHQRDALTKRDRAPVASSKRKVLSNYDFNGNRSKRSGNSQSTALSSLMRPVNVNSTKVAGKEVEVSKKQSTKRDSSLRTPTAKTALRVGQPKQSQLAQSGTTDKKNVGLKVSSSNKTHSRPSTPAAPCSKPPTAKSIVPQAKRNLGKSSSRPTSLTCRNDSPEEIEGRKNPLARDNGAGSIKVEAAYPEKAHLTGGSTQHTQLKAAKPSGLRMPSPSLGFFDQPKASTKGLLNSHTQPSNDRQSSKGSLKSHVAVNPMSELKRPRAREKVQKMTIDDTNLNMGLSTEVSAKSLNLEHQKQNADPESQKMHGFLKDGSEGLNRHAGMHQIEIKPRVDDRNIPVDDEIPFLHTGPCGKEKRSSYEKNGMIGSEYVEGPSKDLAGDATVFSHSPSADSSVCRIQSSFGLPDQIHRAEGVSELLENIKVVESHIYDNEQTSVGKPENQARFLGVGSSEEFQKNCEANSDGSNDQDDNANEEERPCVLPLKLPEQADNDFLGLHDGSTQSYNEDSENLVFFGSPTAGNCGTSLAGDHAAELVTLENKGAYENDELLVGAECMMSINEQPEVHAVEQTAHEKEGAIENDDLLLIEFHNSRGEHQDNALTIEYSPNICQRACEVLLNSSTSLCPVLPSENVHQSEEAKRVEVLYAEENQSAQQERKPLAGNSASFSDQQSIDNMYLPVQVDSSNLASSLILNRDQKTVAATDDTSASFVGLGSDPCSGIKEEDRYVSTPLVSVVEDGDDNMLMDLECDNVEDKQILLSVKYASVRLMTCSPLPDTLAGTELLSREVDNSSHEDSHSGSFGQHHKSKDCNLPIVSGHVEDPSRQDDVDQTTEEFHRFDNSMKICSAVIGQQQLLDGNSSIDCSLKMNGLAGNDNSSVASHRDEQSGYQRQLHHPCSIVELDSQTLQGLSSNDEISTVDNCLKEPKICFASIGSLFQGDVSRSECSNADVCSQAVPVQQDDSGDVGTIYEGPNVEDVFSVSVQKHQSNIYDASLEDDDAVDVKRDEFSEAEKFDVMVSSCQSSEEVGLDVKNDQVELSVNNRCIEASQLKSSTSPEKADSSVPRENFTYDVQRQHQLGTTLNSSKDMTALAQGYICKDGKQESAIVKPPPDAAPFSEEWLAAFEAAGEEILTMKCGAVQNSPPDKPLPEPSPWSPVKRKTNQAIGPFDCTKFTNICNSVPDPSSE